ncbi:MAG: NADH-quinone oxidoreductase subunit M, partial [Fulvivirga sp.]|nr:NADH-quinone oxidoreductase subunit M [Fulvivirga sp.]
WYLDPIYHKTVQLPVIWAAKRVQSFEKRVIDKTIDLFGIFNVILAHAVAWGDRYIVDGMVNFSAWLGGQVGKVTRSIQSGQVQAHMVIAILGLLLIIYWIL